MDEAKAKTVVVDSLNGYTAAMPEESALILHIHELLQYLNRQGATTILTVAQHGLVGDMKAPIDVTYVADTVILLRYFEALGSVRRAISVVKKRTGSHEDTIREYRSAPAGLTLGEPLREFPGRASRRADVAGRNRQPGRFPRRAVNAITGNGSGGALVFAPQGRDASVAAGLLSGRGHTADHLPQ